MNAIDLLIQQHDDHDQLLEQIERSKEGPAKRALFSKLADHLAAHITIEETLFYPAVMTARLEDKLHEAVEEHLAVKRLVTDLLTLPVGDPQFDAKLSVLKESLEHHNRKEEEGELFPRVEKLLSAGELDGLGGEMAALFDATMAEAPRTQLPAETKTAATLPSP